MSNALHATLQNLAHQFIEGVLESIRRASVQELVGEVRVHASRPAAARRGRAQKTKGAEGRSPTTELAGAVDSIVALLKAHPGGLRAEQIRDALGVDRKDLPRPLRHALEAKKVSRAGQKRATTYFAK